MPVGARRTVRQGPQHPAPPLVTIAVRGATHVITLPVLMVARLIVMGVQAAVCRAVLPPVRQLSTAVIRALWGLVIGPTVRVGAHGRVVAQAAAMQAPVRVAIMYAAVAKPPPRVLEIAAAHLPHPPVPPPDITPAPAVTAVTTPPVPMVATMIRRGVQAVVCQACVPTTALTSQEPQCVIIPSALTDVIGRMVAQALATRRPRQQADSSDA